MRRVLGKRRGASPGGQRLRKCWNACVGRAALSPPPDDPPHPSGGVRARRPTKGYKGRGRPGGVEPRPYGDIVGDAGKESPSHGFAVPAPFRQGGREDGGCGCPCCGAQNFCAALRRTLEILTAATRSPRFFCHWQRSARSPRPVCELVSQ